MPMSQIDFVNRRITFHGKGRNGVKKINTTQIHDRLWPRLVELRDAKAVVTCTLPKMAAKEWHTFFKSRPELAHLCFHCTRVTVVTKLARAGVPVQQAMRYVSHASQTIHTIYQKLKADDLSACVAALNF
jgi:integrase